MPTCNMFFRATKYDKTYGMIDDTLRGTCKKITLNLTRFCIAKGCNQ